MGGRKRAVVPDGSPVPRTSAKSTGPRAGRGFQAAVALWGASLAAAGCLGARESGRPGRATPPARAEPVAVGWRRDGTGAFPGAEAVTEWSAEKNVLWRTEVGSSFSSPIVVATPRGERVLATSEPDELVCVNALDGKVLWRKSSGEDDLPADVRPPEGLPERKSDCGNTAPTPASDGRSVYVCFNSGIVACYDLEGVRRWITFFDLDPATMHGRSASPVLVDGRLLVHISHLIALDPETGKEVWQAEDAVASYGTPAVAEIGGRKVVVTPKGDIVRVSDGRIIAAEVASLAYATPFVRGDLVYFIDQFAVAVRLPGEMADRIEAEDVWTADLDGEFFASPVYHEGLIFAVSGTPNYYVIDAATGEIVLQKAPLDLPPAGDTRNTSVFVYPSPVLAGSALFLFNTDGDAFVLAPSRDYREVGRNKLPSGAPGTPSMSSRTSGGTGGGRMFARVGKELYCIGKR